MARMAARRGSGGSRFSHPRKRVWARRNFSDAALSTTVESFNLLSDFTGELGITATPPGVTVGGLLLDYSITQEDTRAASTDALFMGIRVAQEATLSTIDGPLAEQHADWLWYEMVSFSAPTAGLSVGTVASLGGPLRIRAKRRMDEIGMTLVIVFEAVGTTTYSARISSSTLLIMP